MQPTATTKSIQRTMFAFFIGGVVIISTIVILMEILLRVIDPVGIKYFFENDRYFSILESNDTYSYIHPASYSDTFQGVELRMNSWGFRGPEFDQAKAPDTTRVLIMGDSVVLGWGAHQNEIFPSILQQGFENEGRKTEIIPMGVSSWNTRNQFEYLALKGVKLNSDIVVVVIVPNDILPKATGRTDISKDLLFPRESSSENRPLTFRDQLWRTWNSAGMYLYSVKYVQYFMKIESRNEAFNALREDSPKWLDAKLALDKIIDLGKDNEFHLIFFLYGSADTANSNASLKLYKDRLAAREMNYFTFPEQLFDDTKYRISVADGHANADGHVIIANTIYEQLNSHVPARVDK